MTRRGWSVRAVLHLKLRRDFKNRHAHDRLWCYVDQNSHITRRHPTMTDALPDTLKSEVELDRVLSRPSSTLTAELDAIDGDILILGVGGKIGPTLAQLAKQAAPRKHVLGVARFTDGRTRSALEESGIETIVCDLADGEQLRSLPKVANVIFMAGRKFGSAQGPGETWATNARVAAMVANAFRESRIVAFSTGCVYPYVDVGSGGATEATALEPPPGDYGWSCVARERLFQFHSARHGTSGRLLRLNYAIDMRYGVLHDVAKAVFEGRPVDLTTGHVNVIWQGDAASQALRALGHCTTPIAPLNISGPETVSVRWLAHVFGAAFDKEPVLSGREATDAWLVNTSQAARLFGYPSVPLRRMIDWTADWIARGGATIDKPTHFAVRDGVF